MFNEVPPQALKIMKALSYFHFLHNNHLVELGVAASVHSLNAGALNFLTPKRDGRTGELISERGKPLAKNYCLNVRAGNVDDGSGKSAIKLPYLHYLTARGRDYLYWACGDEIDPEDEIWIPAPRAKGKDRLSHDYGHRSNYIYAHIYLRRWAQQAGANIDFFQHYYQSDPNKPRGQNVPLSINSVKLDPRHRPITPDGLCGITHNGKPGIFIVEMHRFTETVRVINQLYNNLKARPAFWAKFPDYPTPHDPVILSVYRRPPAITDSKGTVIEQRPSIKGLVQKRVATDPRFANVLKSIMFADMHELRADFANAWQYADGTKASVFAA